LKTHKNITADFAGLVQALQQSGRIKHILWTLLFCNFIKLNVGLFQFITYTAAYLD